MSIIGMMNDTFFATPTRNRLMGDCVSVAYRLKNQIVKDYSLTDNLVFLMVKTEAPIFPLSNERLFGPHHFKRPDAVQLRVMSSCLTGLLQDDMCDCHDDFVRYLTSIRDAGEGVYAYLPQEGQSRGMLAKLMDHRLQRGFDMLGAESARLSFEQACAALFPGERFDVRTYGFINEVFTTLGLDRLSYNWLGSEPRLEQFKNESGLAIRMHVRS